MTIRLLYLVSHPIQYQAPLLRRIAAEPGIALRVLFAWAPEEGGYHDPGFGRTVAWDVPLREGYANALLSETDLERELRECDVVWLHGWQTRLFRRVLDRAAALGRPVLMRGENTDEAMPDGAGPKGWLKRLYLQRIFRRCTGFLCIGSANRRYYLGRGIAPERLFSMPYAIDNAFFAERAARCDREAVRGALGLPPGRPVVLYAGKLMPRKHPHTLLAAWRAASWPDGGRPVLAYVGDGEMRRNLESEAGEDVHFLGFRNQSELPGIYAMADVFVLASEREPWGLAINEAMACGTAVVASDRCGATADLVDESVGAVVPAGDVQALAAALVRVTADADALGRAARRRVETWGFEADMAGLSEALTVVTR
ncbi:MAG: glycosyltransferase family 4 protein [Alphaproteobacteria bacterium]